MQKMSMAIGILLVASVFPMVTMAHGTCAHETVHTYGVPASADFDAGVVSPGVGATIVNDSEITDCDGLLFGGPESNPDNDGDGKGDINDADFDGDLDIGVGGGAFGHGTYAEHCGFHVETAGSVTVNDFGFGTTVAHVHGSDDATGFLFDPETGENTCITDGLISPGVDTDDCLSGVGTGKQDIVCPGGGDGLLWIFISGVSCKGPTIDPGVTIDPEGDPPVTVQHPPTVDPAVTCSNPPTLGTITSP